MRITPTTMPTNNGVRVSRVPALAGTGLCRASDPARPSAKISGANRPSSITTPPRVWYQVAAVPRPANAEPLLLAMDVNAYMTSVRPCGPGLKIGAWPMWVPIISPATNTVTMARTRMPYIPAPMPPGTISPSAMFIKVMAPPNGVSESWKQLTAPVEVTVVDGANSEQPMGPNLVSTPSVAPCASCGAIPAVPRWVSKYVTPPTAASQRITMIASSV